MNDKIKLSPEHSYPLLEYASQGNAILGIRDSGKTYTATKIAEQLFDGGVPFIAFDPIGVWHSLKIGADGNKGYPVVVAGGNFADLKLTPENASLIVEAAMKENISLIIDLYDMELSKSDWRRIVEKSIRLLLYNNTHLRHIFIEEASEFVPQRIQPQYGSVYAEIEKLARMGRNASLGYTLINQRAEEVNKAVLELCALTLLHKQTGRNSLKAIKEWFKIAQIPEGDSIVSQLPKLGQGECFIVGQQGDPSPERIKVSKKKTIHPDPKNPKEVKKGGISTDVSSFVKKLEIQMDKVKHRKEVRDTFKVPVGHLEVPLPKSKYAMETDRQVEETINTLTEEIAILKEKNEKQQQELLQEQARLNYAIKVVNNLREYFQPQYALLKNLFTDSEQVVTNGGGQIREYLLQYKDKFTSGEWKVVEDLINHGRVTKSASCLRTGISPTSVNGTFDKAMQKLGRLQLMSREGKDFVLKNNLE